jgi:hypothetical protein
VQHGVPFDLAFQLDDETRAGFCIAFCEMEGARFNWNSMQFEERAE